MARNQMDVSYDHALLMKDAGAVSSSAAATVGGDARVIELGAGRWDGRVILDVTAIDVGAGDLASVHVQVSNDDFTSYKSAGVAVFGDVTVNGESADSTVGRVELAFCNEINGVLHSQARLYTLITASGALNYKGFCAKKA